MNQDTTDIFYNAFRSMNGSYTSVMGIRTFVVIGVQCDGVEQSLRKRISDITNSMSDFLGQINELKKFFDLAKSQGTDVHNYSLPNCKKIVEIADEYYQLISKMEVDIKELSIEATKSTVLEDALKRAHEFVNKSVDKMGKWKEAEEKYVK